MQEYCVKVGVDIWAYCLIPDHIPLIAVLETVEALFLAIGEGYARKGWAH